MSDLSLLAAGELTNYINGFKLLPIVILGTVWFRRGLRVGLRADDNYRNDRSEGGGLGGHAFPRIASGAPR